MAEENKESIEDKVPVDKKEVEEIQFPDYIVRMTVELKELNEKFVKMVEFSKKEEFTKFNEIQKTLYCAQFGAMQSYLNILALRINNEKKLYVETKVK